MALIPQISVSQKDSVPIINEMLYPMLHAINMLITVSKMVITDTRSKKAITTKNGT
jgi:hypothetical protein